VYVAIVLVGMMSMVGGMTFVGRRYLIAASVRICKREAVLWRCLREASLAASRAANPFSC